MASRDPDDLVGRRIREYEILDEVGRGGMGSVYRARHTLLDEERAIKVIRSHLAQDPEFVGRFIREARIVNKLRNPHVVRLYEFWEMDGTLFMALEFLRGESLQKRLERVGTLEVREALDIVRQAATGLKAAHELSIVHRDIAPDNLQIVVDEDGRDLVKVMDFGIAKAIEGPAQAQTQAGMTIGKFEYMSPEQCGAELPPGKGIDGRSDIYSLGVTLYRMVAGRHPFQATNAIAYLHKHVFEEPQPPSSHVSAGRISPALDRLILRTLAKRPQDRLASMAELIQDIDLIARALGAPRVAGGELKPGEVFGGRYRIVSKLGEGGMGLVYEAVDSVRDKPVALKVINPRMAAEPGILDRLKREVDVALLVTHRNVCRIFDIGEKDGVHYVSMALLKGQTLGAMLKAQGALPPEQGIPIACDLLDGLAAAHAEGILHRDLKADNVMVTASGQAVIMDFGLAVSKESLRLTEVGKIVGTPGHMAPEYIAGGEFEPRSDLYAVGVILFRMFTGRFPFEGDLSAVLRAQMHTPPPRPSSLAPQISPQLERIIIQALEKRPADRFASATEMRAVLSATTFAPSSPTSRPSLVPRPVEVDGSTMVQPPTRAADEAAAREAETSAARMREQAERERRETEQLKRAEEARHREEAERRRLDEARRREEDQRVKDAVVQARRLFETGRREAALKQLEPLSSSFPAAKLALDDLRAEAEAIAARQRQEAERKKAEEESRLRETERRKAEEESRLRETERRKAEEDQRLKETERKKAEEERGLRQTERTRLDQTRHLPLEGRTRPGSPGQKTGRIPTVETRPVLQDGGQAPFSPSPALQRVAGVLAGALVVAALVAVVGLWTRRSVPVSPPSPVAMEPAPVGPSPASPTPGAPTPVPSVSPSLMPSPSVAPSPTPKPTVQPSLRPTPASASPRAPEPAPTPTANATPAPARETPAPSSTSPHPAPPPEAAVRQAIADYVAAFESLDPGAIRAVWPTIPRKELEQFERRNFRSLKMTLEVLRVDMLGATRAAVACRTSLTFRGSGGGGGTTNPRNEDFVFEQQNGRWLRVR